VSVNRVALGTAHASCQFKMYANHALSDAHTIKLRASTFVELKTFDHAVSLQSRGFPHTIRRL